MNFYKRWIGLLAQREEFRVQAPRGTSEAVNDALLDIGAFHCFRCQKSFAGMPTSILKLKNVGRVLCACRACSQSPEVKEAIPCR